VTVAVAFEEFVAARLPALLRFAAALTGDRATAEDTVQEALVRAHARWRRIAPMEQPEAYVRKMILNEYLSWRRRFARIEPRAQPPMPHHDGPDHATVHAERDALRAELARLPRRQRAVLVLRYYAGMSDAEIAEALDCSAGTVRGYASRALATLRMSATADNRSTTRSVQ
jgi:RNA polymerase sigma-70 factor (sigma-E family)